MTGEPKEHFDEFLAFCLGMPNPRPADMRSTYGLMAAMLRANCLTGSGREFLADRLQEIADGADPTRVLLPRNRKPPAPPTLRIMAEVERERAKRGPGDLAGIHERVGKRHGDAASTISKLASRGRTHLRRAVAHMVAAGRIRMSTSSPRC